MYTTPGILILLTLKPFILFYIACHTNNENRQIFHYQGVGHCQPKTFQLLAVMILHTYDFKLSNVDRFLVA